MIYVGGATGLRNLGAYSTTTTYFPNDLVSYNGNTYLATSVTTNNLPGGTTFWQLLAAGGWPRSTAGATVVNQTNRAQANLYTLSAYTTGTTAIQLTTDGAAATTSGTPNVVVVPPYSTWVFQLSITGRVKGGNTNSQGFLQTGMVVRDGTGSQVRLVGAVTQLATWADTTIGTVAVSANTTGNYLQIQITPTLSFTTWHAVLEVNELTTQN